MVVRSAIGLRIYPCEHRGRLYWTREWRKRLVAGGGTEADLANRIPPARGNQPTHKPTPCLRVSVFESLFRALRPLPVPSHTQLIMPRMARLDRALSKLGIASRTEARRAIEAGEVRVEGRIVRDPSALVRLETVRVEVAGRELGTVPWRTIALNKPRGVITTRRDPEGRRTVFDVLGGQGTSLVAVGRLDQASTGLLLLTTDTQLANWLTSPESAIVRRYVVTARGFVDEISARRMKTGIGDLRAHSVTVRKRSKRETHLVIELTEGRNREIRRLLQAEGHEVTRLLRVSFGGIELGTLQPGEWREVTRGEIDIAFPQRAPSLHSERQKRIDAGRAPRRDESGKQGDGQKQSHSSTERDRIGGSKAKELRFNTSRRKERGHQTGEDADR
jgi:23S rRNA pseudouridine2605 synthase